MIKLKITCLTGLILLTTVSVMSQTDIQSALVQEALAETESIIYLPYDCDNYGGWNEEDRICVLNQDIDKSIEIMENNITLDCNNHKIIVSSDSSFYSGIHTSDKNDIAIKNCTIANFFYGIFFQNTHNSRIDNIIASGNDKGINFFYSTNNTISNSNFLDNYFGIHLNMSDNNVMVNNNISGNRHGIPLSDSANNTIANSDLSNNGIGIAFSYHSDGNTITENNILNNSDRGIHFQYSDDNTITKNTLSGNKYGLVLYSAAANKVYHNNFINNYYQATLQDQSEDNFFDNGYPDGGNYWGDYDGVDFFSGFSQDLFGSDGIGDTPYIFSGGQDYYPLVEEIEWETSKTVPLYTQVISGYPSREETVDWSSKDYAKGLDYGCGSKIAGCGCAITSMIMIGRFYDIDVGIDNSNADPKNINDWLNNNHGYSGPNLYWSKAVEYLGQIDDGEKMARLSFDYYNEPSSSSRIDDYVDSGKPIVAYSNTYGHYFVIDGKLNDIYTVKDPYWYNTKTLDDSIANHVQDYNNYFTKANLFSHLETPRKIAALMHIYLASPAELLVTDPNGKKLGKDPVGGEIYNGISNSSYTTESAIISSDNPPDEIHERKVIYIPAPVGGMYKIQVIGTGDGDYTLTLLVYDNEGESREVIQKGNIIQNDIQEFELDYSTQSVRQTKNYQLINVDIKPGSEQNSINLKSKGVTPVAVLSNEFFNTQEINIDSISFAEANLSKWKVEDIDDDGDLDLMLHFETQSLDLDLTDTKATLTGELNNGTSIKGSDFIRIISKNK